MIAAVIIIALTWYRIIDESKGETAEGVARSPNRFCSRDGDLFITNTALSTGFSVSFIFLFCFALFLSLFPFPPPTVFMSISSSLLRVASCVQQSCVRLKGYVALLLIIHLRHLYSVSFHIMLFLLYCLVVLIFWTGLLWCVSRTRYVGIKFSLVSPIHSRFVFLLSLQH